MSPRAHTHKQLVGRASNSMNSCDQCDFMVAYDVSTADGVLRLCGGCLGDLRAKGHRAVIVNRKVAA